MTKRSYKPFLREAEMLDDEPIEDLEDVEQDEDDDIISQIEDLVSRINNLRKRKGDRNLLDPDSFPVSTASVEDLLDIFDEEQSNTMVDREPTDDEIFDMPEDLENEYDDYEEPQQVPTDNTDMNDNESDFINAIDYQLKFGEDQRSSFYLVLKKEPDVDYEAVVITKFGSSSNPSFLFNILSIDGEDVDIEKQIRFSDIDIERSDFSNLMD